MTDATPKARPIWAHRTASTDDTQCGMAVPQEVSPDRRIRCSRGKAEEYQGYPVCSQHYRKLTA